MTTLERSFKLRRHFESSTAPWTNTKRKDTTLKLPFDDILHKSNKLINFWGQPYNLIDPGVIETVELVLIVVFELHMNEFLIFAAIIKNTAFNQSIEL